MWQIGVCFDFKFYLSFIELILYYKDVYMVSETIATEALKHPLLLL